MMAFRLHSRLVALNIAAIATATGILGYFFLGGNLRSTLESEVEQQLYHSATLAKAYVTNQRANVAAVDVANEISTLLNLRVTIRYAGSP